AALNVRAQFVGREMRVERIGGDYEPVRHVDPGAEHFAERLGFPSHHRRVGIGLKVEAPHVNCTPVAGEIDDRHAGLAFTPSRYKRMLKARWMPGPITRT